MLCYKDKAFCTYWEDCSGYTECGRALTPNIRTAADKWWGSEGAPISVFVTKPNCWQSKTPTDIAIIPES
jgi:hypothetical protein